MRVHKKIRHILSNNCSRIWKKYENVIFSKSWSSIFIINVKASLKELSWFFATKINYENWKCPIFDRLRIYVSRHSFGVRIHKISYDSLHNFITFIMLEVTNAWMYAQNLILHVILCFWPQSLILKIWFFFCKTN